MYLFRMANISLLRIWYFLMRSAIFFSGYGRQHEKKGCIFWTYNCKSSAMRQNWGYAADNVYPPHFWWSRPCHPAFGLWAGGSRSRRGQSDAAVPAARWWHSRPSSAHPQSTACKDEHKQHGEGAEGCAFIMWCTTLEMWQVCKTMMQLWCNNAIMFPAALATQGSNAPWKNPPSVCVQTAVTYTQPAPFNLFIFSSLIQGGWCKGCVAKWYKKIN